MDFLVMVLNKGDFIEIQFTGKIKDGAIFDSNRKEDLDKTNLNGHAKNFIFPLGEGMFIKGVDEFLIGKDIGEHNIDLNPEDAFGKRDPKLIQTMPLKMFSQQKLNPIPGAVFNFDGKMAKVMTVSSGRVMVDFNNPMAGKNVEYKINVLKKVTDINEKVDALNDFFFRKTLEFNVDDKTLKLKVPKEMMPFIEMFKDKYKNTLGLQVEVIETETSKISKEKAE